METSDFPMTGAPKHCHSAWSQLEEGSLGFSKGDGPHAWTPEYKVPGVFKDVTTKMESFMKFGPGGLSLHLPKLTGSMFGHQGLQQVLGHL